jgi:PUB domain/VHL beta domain
MPQSRRGNVAIALHVTNVMPSANISVKWVDYKGKEIDKGTIQANGGVWTQSTFVEHPWVFRDESTSDLLFYFVPYRTIPPLFDDRLPLRDEHDPDVGMHRFTIAAPDAGAQSHLDRISIEDPTFPYPSERHLRTPSLALQWAFRHGRRMRYQYWPTFIKYLSQIVQHPTDSKYRRIRTNNRTFGSEVYNVGPAQGMIWAMGFVQHGGYVELGTDTTPYPRERIQALSQLLYLAERHYERVLKGTDEEDALPEGALDGFGRAGWGRPGNMNFPSS